MRRDEHFFYSITHSHTREGFQVRKRYGLGAFMFDIIMCAITGGLWLIWIFVREMRSH